MDELQCPLEGHRMNQPKLETRPQANDTRLIPLTQGQFAIVDAADYEWLSNYKWQAKWNEKTRSFYAIRTTSAANGQKPTTVTMHRQILGLAVGDQRLGDHIESGDTLNNSRSNLRIANEFQNQHNRRRRRDSSSGLKGVTPQDGKWKAEIRANGKWYYLGFHTTKEAAYAAYCEAAKRLHGEFARV
jgi:hypothetical protein